MSTNIRAHVYRDRRTGLWFIDVDDPTARHASTWTRIRKSHAEAMQAAHVMLRDLDGLLMDEVHESRAQRRTEAMEPTA